MKGHDGAVDERRVHPSASSRPRWLEISRAFVQTEKQLRVLALLEAIAQFSSGTSHRPNVGCHRDTPRYRVMVGLSDCRVVTVRVLDLLVGLCVDIRSAADILELALTMQCLLLCAWYRQSVMRDGSRGSCDTASDECLRHQDAAVATQHRPPLSPAMRFSSLPTQPSSTQQAPSWLWLA